MIRVLHSVSNMDRAGIETMLMNYYRHIDREKVQFDFLCNKSKPGAYDAEISELGGRIFHTPGLNPTKYLQYLNYMKQIFTEYPEFKIVEAHNGALGVYALHSAKVNYIPIRIFHAHGASITKDWKMPIKLFCKSRLKSNINQNFTCGIAAAEYYFGKNIVLNNQYELIPNAIEVEKFLFNNGKRNEIRTRYGINDKYVIGHVGRFMTQKNHKFLISAFEQVYKKNKNAVLVLLGDGELMDEIKTLVNKKNLNVIFVGNVENVNEWYSAFDVFVLPSIWEGLPVVGVEAQAADLPCLFSDTITKEIGFSKKSQFISTDDAQKWANSICDIMKKPLERMDKTELITTKGYNIRNEAVKLQDRYLKLYEETVK